MASIDEQIEAAPFTPQKAGMSASNFPVDIFKPKGNAMPINSPNGRRMPVARRIRIGVVEESNALMTRGVKRPKIIKTTHSNNRRTAECQLGFTKFDVVKLPIPPESNNVKRTTDKA